MQTSYDRFEAFASFEQPHIRTYYVWGVLSINGTEAELEDEEVIPDERYFAGVVPSDEVRFLVGPGVEVLWAGRIF